MPEAPSRCIVQPRTLPVPGRGDCGLGCSGGGTEWAEQLPGRASAPVGEPGLARMSATKVAKFPYSRTKAGWLEALTKNVKVDVVFRGPRRVVLRLAFAGAVWHYRFSYLNIGSHTSSEWEPPSRLPAWG